MLKKLIMVVGITLISVTNFFPSFAQAETIADINKKVYGTYGIAINAKDGKVLYSKKGYEKAYPASMTKVMTAILLVEHVKPGSVLTASKHAVSQEESNDDFLLKVGEKMTRDEALEALMVLSSNDVAAMIGEYISGTEKNFGELMTKKAKEFGAKNTKFVNASGLHDLNHYTTAYDMAMIFKQVMKYPEITKYMKTNKATIVTNKRTVNVTSSSLTYQYKELAYGKIGWTPEAGNTLVSLVKDKGQEVISVVMKSKKPQHYTDTITMGKYGASQLSSGVVVNQMTDMKKYDGGSNYLTYINGRGYSQYFYENKAGTYQFVPNSWLKAVGINVEVKKENGKKLLYITNPYKTRTQPVSTTVAMPNISVKSSIMTDMLKYDGGSNHLTYINGRGYSQYFYENNAGTYQFIPHSWMKAVGLDIQVKVVGGVKRMYISNLYK